MHLEHNLYCKRELKFRPDGSFKILMMSDIQEGVDYDPRTPEAIDRLVEKERPDFVLLGGDNCDGRKLKTAEELKRYLEIFVAPMEKRGILWAHVFGNHDYDVAMDRVEQTKLYEQFPHCVSKHTEDISGVTNFVLPILHSNGEGIAFHLWGMDTKHYFSDSGLPYEKEIRTLQGYPVASKWDVIRFDQQMWYWNSSLELESHNKAKVDGMLFMHVAPWEFQYAVDNPERMGTKGSTVERQSLGMLNSGIFSTVLQRGDIRCIACGHTHSNSFEGSFCGIKMCLDACAGYTPPSIDALRGGRVFLLNESDTSKIQTYMSHYQDL